MRTWGQKQGEVLVPPALHPRLCGKGPGFYQRCRWGEGQARGGGYCPWERIGQWEAGEGGPRWVKGCTLHPAPAPEAEGEGESLAWDFLDL